MPSGAGRLRAVAVPDRGGTLSRVKRSVPQVARCPGGCACHGETHPLLRLQRMVGNRGVARLVASGTVTLNRAEDSEEPPVRPVPPVRGRGKLPSLVAYAGLSLQGRTRASFSHTYRTEDLVTERGEGCTRCRGPNCVHVTGRVVTDYSVSTTVTLPAVPRRLRPCQRERVRTTIDTVLAPHEQQHVDAFKTYEGTSEQAVDVTACRGGVSAAIQALVRDEATARRDAAQAASDALDPFQTDVDLDCED